jgi:hypothetical protein
VLESAQVGVSVLELELLMVLDLDAIDLEKCWERGRGLVLRQGWLLELALARRSALAMELVLELESLLELAWELQAIRSVCVVLWAIESVLGQVLPLMGLD